MARYEEGRNGEDLFWDEGEPYEPYAAAGGGRVRTGQLDPEDASSFGEDEGDSWQRFFHEPVREPYGGAAGTGEAVPYGGRRFGYGRETPVAREYGQLYGHDQRNYGHRRDTYYAAHDAAPWWEVGRGAVDEDDGSGLHVGKGPRGYRRSDERIAEEVVERLAEASWVDASELEVEVSEGVVTLSGEVASRRERRAAEEVAAEVTGVEDVVNSVRVRRLPQS
jgi:hypothetical protein